MIFEVGTAPLVRLMSLTTCNTGRKRPLALMYACAAFSVAREIALSSPSEPVYNDAHPAASRAEQLAEQLRRVIGSLVREVRSGAHTPSSAQSETLGFIDRHGPASITDMAVHRHVKHQSMRLVIAQLERQRLVTRAPDPDDARKQLIELTGQGREALERSRQQRSDWLARQIKEKTTAAQLQTLEAAVKVLEQLLSADQDH